MDFIADYFRELMSRIPYQVIVAVFAVIIVTELTKQALHILENCLEAKKGGQIKFFDHTKIIFSLFWSLVLSVSFAFGGIYSWAELPMYFLVIIGGATVFYELVWKKIRGCYGGDK